MHPESNSQKFHQINTCHRVAPMKMLHSIISFRFSFSPCFSLPSHSTWHSETNQSSYFRKLTIRPFLPPILILLPFFLFHFLFTLLSKFFSAFVHTTCSLSVSRPYLAFRVRYPVHSRSIPNERDSFSLFASSPCRLGF